MISDETIDGLQIRIISDSINTDALVQVAPRSVMFTDYYVFVVDDIAKVQKLNINRKLSKTDNILA